MAGWAICIVVFGLILLLLQSSPLGFAEKMEEVRNAPGSSIAGCEKTNECFIPYTVTIDGGGTVIWINNDTASHTVTSGTQQKGADGEFDSGLLMPGKKFSFKFDKEGTYPYFCVVHPWMSGTVIVQEEIDTDGDGIPDDIDFCPAQPETFNGYLDEDGCPDALPPLDSDSDGIPDFMDSCPTKPETFNNYQDEDGCPDELQGSDGTMSIEVDIETNIPQAGGPMSINVEFRDAESGKLIQNINYDIRAKQGNQVILDEGVYESDGQGVHITNALSSDASDDNPVDVEVTLNGIGLPDNPSAWTGPQGQTENAQVVPEFDSIVMMILVSGIGGIVALCAKSKLIMRI